MKNDDVALIHCILSGDENAFESLVEKYQKQVHALAWRKIGDFHIAEEITQDTFLKVYQKLSTLKDPNQFSGWLYVIATNQCRTWLRKKRIETEPLGGTDNEWIDETAYSRYVAEEHAKVTTETQREVVKKLLAKLKESERTVMTLHYLGEMTTEEISRFLGVSTSAIKLRLHRARQRLQKEETMIREALSNFQLSPNLTETIMQKVERIKPATPSGSKPFIPWVIGASSIALIVLMLGLGSQHLAHFQQRYSLDAQSEMTVELVDASVMLNLEAKPDFQNQLGQNANETGRGNSTGQETNQVVSDKREYTQWGLPKNSKARLGKGLANDMAYSSKSSRLAVASSIGVWIYDAHTGKELALLTGHANAVRAVALSPDGLTVAGGGGLGENTIRIWDIRTGEQKVLLSGHSRDIRTLAFSPDGKTLASAGEEKIIRLWDSITGQRKQSLSGHDSAVYSLAFSPDGETIASGSWDNTVRLWNTETGELKRTLVGHTERIFSVAFSPDGKLLVSAGWDNTIRLWHSITGQHIITLSDNLGMYASVAFSSDNRTIACGSLNSKYIQLWNVETGQRDKISQIPQNGVNVVKFSKDGNILFSMSWDGTIHSWDVVTKERIFTIEDHTRPISSVAYSPDGKTLASALGEVIWLWDIDTRKHMMTLEGHKHGINAVAFSPDNRTLASGSWNGGLRLWNTDTGLQIMKLNGHTKGIRSVTFSSNGRMLASAGNDHTIRVWDVQSGEQIHKHIEKKGRALSVAFSPDCQTLASSGFNGVLRFWDMDSGQEKLTLPDTGNGFSIAYSPNGVLIASSGMHIKLWHTNTGECIQTFELPKNMIENINTNEPNQFFSGYFGNMVDLLAYSPDGKTIAGVGKNGMIRIFNIETGKPMHSYSGHKWVVKSLAFSPDGNTLVSGSVDGTILLWDLTSATNAN